MEIEVHPTAEAFLARAGAWLLRQEAKYNSVASYAYLLSSGNHPFREPLLLATVADAQGVAGCAVSPPPDRLSMTDLPAGAAGSLAVRAAALAAQLPGVTGPEADCDAFAASWVRQRGGTATLCTRQRLYRADRVAMPRRRVPGALRLASPDDAPLARAWAAAFARDVNTDVDVVAFFQRRLRSASLYLWDDGGPCSLVAVSGYTPNGIRISAVYTPPERRGNGYAGAAVATVSGMMLAAGNAFCVLFTDAADPVPNALYPKLGYRPIWDTVTLDFA